MKKLKNRKGFTLAELLIVVAIIAVLVAISIPVFTSQLEKSREAVDLANIRAAYAECTSAVLTNDGTGYYKEVVAKQKTAGWNIDIKDVAGKNLSTDAEMLKMKEGVNLFVCVDGAGAFSVTTTEPTTGYTEIS